LAGGRTVTGATTSPERRETMRRITALILVVATAVIGAAFPLAASATHGGVHGSVAVRAQ
jgi:hypothetical protein